MRNPIAAIAIGLNLCTASMTGQADTYTYRISEIGKTNRLGGINHAGHVTGNIRAAFPNLLAFWWNGTKPMTFVPYAFPEELEISETEGTDISNTGLISVNAIGGCGHYAFIWNTFTNNIAPLPSDNSNPCPHTDSRAINSHGHVTGVMRTAGGNRAFLWDGIQMRDLGVVSGLNSEGNGLNNSGHVTGWTQFGTAPLFSNRAFHWDGTKMEQIGTLGGSQSIGEAINAKNQIVGSSSKAGDTETHAFLWQNGLMQDLGTLGGASSRAVSINNSGQVVGVADTPDGQLQFLWERGVMRPVLDLVAANDPLKSAINIGEPIDINNLGQIVTTGLNAENRPRAYLLSPSYKVTSFISPTSDSWKLGSTVRVAVGLLDAANARISDSRATLLAAAPCRVVVLASGAQTLAKKCMTYDAAANQFFFNWNLRNTGTGSATIEVRVNYGAPGPLKTIKTKTITITS